MGANLTGTYITAILSPTERTEWTAESGYYDAGGARLGALQPIGPRTGYPVPTGSYALALRGHGEQIAGQTMVATVTRAGLPVTESLGLTWTDTQSASPRGCDPPVRPHTWTPIATAGGHRWPQSITTRLDTVIEIYRNTTTAAIELRRHVAGGITWSAAVTVSALTTSQDAGPTICRIPIRDGERLLALFWTAIGSDWQVSSAWSADDGLTWVAGHDVLAVPISGTTYTVLHRLRAVEMGGQIWLVGHVEAPAAAVDDVLLQWASTDGGSVFDLVEAFDGTDFEHAGACPDLIRADDYVICAWLTVDPDGYHGAYIVRMTDAWQRIRTSDLRDVGGVTGHFRTSGLTAGRDWCSTSATAIEGWDLTIWYDTDGHLYASGRDTALFCCPVIYSSDYGRTWNATGADPRYVVGGGEVWWDHDDADEIAVEFSATCQHGATIMVTGFNSASHQGLTGHQASLTLGGHTTITLPHRSGSMAHTRRGAWQILYQPSCVPAAGGYFATAGAGAAAIVSDVLVLTGAIVMQSIALTNGLTTGIITEIDYDPTWSAPGKESITGVVISSGAASYDIEVRESSTQVRIYDLNTGLAVATLARVDSGRVRVLIGLQQVGGSGIVRAWITSDLDDDAVWTEIGRVSGLTAGGTATSYVYHSVAALDVSDVRGFWASSGIYVGDGLVQTIDRAQLYPCGVTQRPRYLGDGVSVSAVTGPGLPGDSFTLTPTSEYPVSACDPRIVASPHVVSAFAAADMPAGTTEIRISWQIGTSDTLPLSPLWGIYLDGICSPIPAVRLYYGGVWNTVAGIPVDRFQVNRQGRGVGVASSGTIGTHVYETGETAGWGCTVATTAGVLESTTIIEESWQGSSSRSSGTALWRGRLASDAGLAGANHDIALWPSRGLFVLRMAAYSVQIRGYQVRLPVNAAATYPGRPADGIWRLGVCAAGPLLPIGPRCAQVHQIEADPQVEVEEADDGTATAWERGYHRTSYTMVWPDPSPGVFSTSPDYLLSVVAMGFAYDFMAPIDIVRQLRGSLYPVVAVPSCPLPGSAAKYALETERWARCYYGRIAGIITADTIATGEEGRTDAARVSEIQIRGEG